MFWNRRRLLGVVVCHFLLGIIRGPSLGLCWLSLLGCHFGSGVFVVDVVTCKDGW
jgi:hypothetical protein